MTQTARKPLPLWASVLIVATILVVGVVPVLYYILGPARGYMTSDTTDSVLWAYRAYVSGKAADPNFYYAAILPFGGNQIYFPFVAIFGYSMAAQLCGLTLFALLFAAALWFFFSGVGLDRYRSAAGVSLTMLILSSGAKLREILWEHIFYYNLGILFFCVGMGLVFRLLDVEKTSEKPRRVIAIISAVCLGLFSLFAATDGLQALICFSLPLCAGIFTERLFSSDDLLGKTGKRSLWLILFVIGTSLVGVLFGKLLTGGATAGYQEAYSTWSDPSEWTDNLLGFLPNWFSLLGVNATSSDALTSGASLLNMIRVAGGILLPVLPLFLVFRWKSVGRRVRIALIGHLTVCACILFAVIFGSLGGANWRLVPMLGTSVLLSILTAAEYFRSDKIRRRLAVLFLALLLLLAAIPFGTILGMPAKYGRDNSWFAATEALEARGLRYGYANFWWAEYVTLLSGGDLEVGNIREWEKEPVAYRYQCMKNAFTPKDDAENYFLLLTEDENMKMSAWLRERERLGVLVDSFTVDASYDLRGHKGDRLYVYVYSVSPLEAVTE